MWGKCIQRPGKNKWVGNEELEKLLFVLGLGDISRSSSTGINHRGISLPQTLYVYD